MITTVQFAIREIIDSTWLRNLDIMNEVPFQSPSTNNGVAISIERIVWCVEPRYVLLAYVYKLTIL